MSMISRPVLIIAAFGLAASAPPALAKSYGGVVLSDQSPGWVTKVRPGEPVEIRLTSQPGTGYSWTPTSYASKVHPLPPLQGAMIPGGKQTQRFLFRTKKSGLYIVSFSYGQPWKGGDRGAKSRSFTIKVR